MATAEELEQQRLAGTQVGQQAAIEQIQTPTVGEGETLQATGTAIAGEQLAAPTAPEFQIAPTEAVTAAGGAAQAPVSAPGGITAAQVDPSLVGQGATVTAAQGTAAQQALQQGELVTEQLATLLQPGPNGETPAFALPAVRAVEQMLQERGIGRTSIAGADITSAIIQAAIPLASQNAQALQRRSEINLNNRQQIVVQNLNNDQQASMANAQFEQQVLLSDQSSDNAARHFNATSENQTNQFMTNLSSNIKLTNAARLDAMEQFNVNSENAVNQFNEQIQFSRDQFNAQNSTAINQSNLQWRRQVATAETAAENQANFSNAQNAFSRTNAALAFTWQEARDLADQQWKSLENNLDRLLNYETSIEVSQINAKSGLDRAALAAAAGEEAAETNAYALLIGATITAIGDNWRQT
jgi:hypothetical protein